MASLTAFICEYMPSYNQVWMSNVFVCNCGRHVQVSNDEALSFYQNFGFKIREKEERYYKRIQPADAYVLEKDANELVSS